MSGKRINFLVVLVFILSLPVGVANAQVFSDVEEDFWAYESIEWANSEGIINGYEDGTFEPNETFTEAQFASILMEYFDMSEETPSDGNHWAQGIYDSLGNHDLPLQGYTNDSEKNSAINRGTLARVIAATQDHDDDIHSAVDFMYENNISSGRDGEQTYEAYGVSETLTRAQAAVFFSNLEDSGLTVIRDEGTEDESTTDEENVQEEMAEETNETENNDENNNNEDIGTRNNPLSHGQTAEIQDTDLLSGKVHYSMTLIESVSGEDAEDMVMEANPYNSTTEANKEYILAKFKVKLHEVTDAPFNVNGQQFDVISEGGSSYEDFVSVAGLEPNFGSDLYNGGETEGWVAFVVDKDDNKPLAKYNEAWFDLRDSE
ncbi:S-layer homology domain-containing protein [Salibacterium aidingense]|uniref:S-layer homology domain-containing protein n=1 Tax=Salibacterium aidingense TaxID=384933 RepID=UPI00040D9CEF|nr:S-layer homology domain-containing protein [Salibacterium aidingense]